MGWTPARPIGYGNAHGPEEAIALPSYCTSPSNISARGTSISDGCFDSTVQILFDGDDPEEAGRATACY
jgi:hypothetical protein